VSDLVVDFDQVWIGLGCRVGHGFDCQMCLAWFGLDWFG